MSEQTASRLLVVILALFVALGLAYALTTPTLEAPDEIYHYEYIRSLINTGRPPVLEEGGGRGFGHHAPLYYAMGAFVSFWVGENDLARWDDLDNPFFGYRFGDVGRDNKNLYLHPDDDRLGGSDTWLGIRVVRAMSVLLGAVTVWAIYRVGCEVFDRPEMALGAAGLAAFIPEFLFISGAVNDDNGAALFGALALWAMVRILRRGLNLRRALGLGLALGLGWLSKLTVVALVATAGLTLLVASRQAGGWLSRPFWRTLLRWGLVIFGVAALLVVPWLVRQTLLYGDPTGTAREMSEWGLRQEPVTLADLGPDLYWLRTSFWGRLGYNQIPLSRWIYVLLDLFTLLALAGLGRLALASRRAGVSQATRQQIAILGAAFLLSFLPMIVRRFLRPMPNFGRYLFPVLPAIALLFFTGLAAWLPRRRQPALALGVTAAMLLLGTAGLAGFLAPAYARPPIYTTAEAPEPAHWLGWTYLEHGHPLARLRGYDLQRTVVEPGDTVRVTLHWEVLGETDADHVLFAQLFGRQAARVGQRDTYPGLGHYPTSFWQAGQVILDQVPIPVDAAAVGPSRLRLDVGLYSYDDGQRLAVVDGDGNPVGAATAGWLKIAAGGDAPQPVVSTSYRLGESITLIGYDLRQGDGQIDLTLYWTALLPPPQDYTVFVHLLGPDDELARQADGPPVNGDYPTSFWAPGEVVDDERHIPIDDLPPGRHRLVVGMYLLETGDRLPALAADGARLPDDSIPLLETELP
ncbi:MAG: glycosyltransferase family 39 protein [Anaerolineae bacterium]|nr:glycosyltransferase family 39 protein [Anaerolineae bacterium]